MSLWRNAEKPEEIEVANDDPTPVATTRAPDSASTLIKLEDGTPVHLFLSDTISSADAKVGQTIPFEVGDDVVIDGVCVIPHGANASPLGHSTHPCARK